MTAKSRIAEWAFVLAGLMLFASSIPAYAQVASKSTWEQVMSTKKLRSGVMDAPPYWHRDKGQWKGAMVKMSQDIADQLGVELELVEVAGWGQVALELQSNRVDMMFSVQATPARAKVIDFAGPVYWVYFATVNNKNFKAPKNWADYNSPDVKIAVALGSSNETILRKMAPKATIQAFTKNPEVILSVISGRSDALVSTTMTALTMKQENPDSGEFVVPQPQVGVPGYIGLRQDVGDTRMRDFLNWWSEWNLLMGNNEKLLKESLLEMGIPEIPDFVRF